MHFLNLIEEWFYNRKTWHLKFETFEPSAYLALLPPDVARVILRARLRMLLIWKWISRRNMIIILTVHSAVYRQRILITFLYVQLANAKYAPKSIRSITLEMLGTISDIYLLSKFGKCLLRYEKYREIVLWGGLFLVCQLRPVRYTAGRLYSYVLYRLVF